MTDLDLSHIDSTRRHSRKPSAFFDEVHHRFQQAADRAGVIERDFVIDTYRVRLRFAGNALLSPMTTAIEHLAVPLNGEADLTVCLWDSASTGVEIPTCPWEPEQVMPGHGLVRGYNDSAIRTALAVDVNALSMLDKDRSLGFYWLRQGHHPLPPYERAAPLKSLLHWWLHDRGLHMAHSGAVGADGGAVLLVGKTGAGKSSAALACLNAGLNYLADDHCLVKQDPNPCVYSLYNSAKLEEHHLQRFPDLLPLVSNPEEVGPEKALVWIHQHFRSRMAVKRPLRAILLCRITGRPHTELQGVSPMQILRDLIPSTMVYLPGMTRADVGALSRLVQSLPCRLLAAGTRLDEIPDVIRQLIERG